MSTRYLIAALLMTSACVAHADVTTTTPPPSSILTSWTTGNGSDVIGSGVLSNNTSLIGGVSHGTDASVAQDLYQKASANAAKTNGVVKVSYSQGIQGDFLTRTSNAMLVAILGGSLSAVSSPDGAIITSGATYRAAAGGTPTGSGSSAPSGTQSGTQSGGTQSGGTQSGGTQSGGTQSGGTQSGGTQGGGTNSGTDNSLLTGGDTTQFTPVRGQAPVNNQAGTTNVPEPSSIALLAAGLFGAAGLRRRAKR